jgi:hypothetical protein
MTDDGYGRFHTITNKDVWEKLTLLEATIGKLVTAVEIANGRTETHEKKIRALELKFYGVVAGLLAALSLAATGFIVG